MPQIKLLDKVTQDQIAAGEVIDQPASVLKELIENSLDANSSSIYIEILNGGKSLIRIIDNGQGIPKEDMQISARRYATSKIQDISDLQSVQSFGFRGEALASIAAVSKMTIISSKNKSETYKLIVEGGKQKYFEQTESIIGTDISIEDLFFNVQARKKFLKNDNTELRSIIKVFNNFALINFNVSFKLSHNGKILVDLPKANNWLSRIENIYPKNITNNLVPISYQTPDIFVKGFISKPEGLVKQKYYQSLYVNNRQVQDRTVYKALTDGYRGLIVKGLNPIFIISIDLLPELLDINVHPQKKEIKLLYPSDVFRAVYLAVEQGIYSRHKAQGIRQEENPLGKMSALNPSATSGSWQYRPHTESFDMEFSTPPKPEPLEPFSKKPYKILGQIKKSYILLEEENSFQIIDQHAAHERILYEKFKKSFEEKSPPTQKLAIPLMIEITTEEKIIFENNRDIFDFLGYKIDLFDEKTLILEEIPSLVTKKEITTEFIREIFANLEDSKDFKKLSPEDIIDKKLQSMACRSAVMFGDKLEYDEMVKIVDELEELHIPYCPHGRPAKIELSWEELEKMFKRIV